MFASPGPFQVNEWKMCVENLYWKMCHWWLGVSGLLNFIWFFSLSTPSLFLLVGFCSPSSSPLPSCLPPHPSSHPSSIWLVFTHPSGSNITCTYLSSQSFSGLPWHLSITLLWHLALAWPIQLVKWLTPQLTQKQVLYVSVVFLI